MDSKIKLTDKELLHELSIRFEQNYKMLKELEELNDKLIDSEKMKSHFLSNIKNEINNPISSILGLSLDMLGKKNNEESIAVNSKLIYEEAFSLNFQLKNIFCAAEIEGGQSQPEISNVNVSQVVEAVIENYKFLADKKNVVLELEIAQNLIFNTDTQKLSLIVSNIISNAIKFSKDKGMIKIQVSINSNRNLNVTVQDDGIGIKEEDKKIIFDRFKQVEFGLTKPFSGHGLGLSIVSSLVEVLEGKIELSSVINHGTAITVSIPEENVNTNEFSDLDNSFIFLDENSNDELF